MPKRSTTNPTRKMATAWKKRERRTFIGSARRWRSFQREQEGDQVHVLLGRQARAEILRHDAGWEAGHRATALGIEDLLHDVVGRLDLRDLRQVGADRRGADLARLVTRDARALALEHQLTGLGIAGNLQLGRRAAT